MQKLLIGGLCGLLAVHSWAAANYYVLSGSGGNGSAWNNAYGDLPASLNRGDTYYVASGTYGQHIFNDAETGATVYIKKATAGAHGAETGWNSAYGVGEALFSSGSEAWVFPRGNYDIDGVFGSGKSPGGYGFRVYTSASRNSPATIVAIHAMGGAPRNVDNVKLRHVEFDFNNGTASGESGAPRNITLGSAWGAPNDGTLIQYCYFHHSAGYAIYCAYGTSNFTIEHSYFYRNGGGGGPDAHWETFWNTEVSNLKFRYNTVDNTFGTLGQTGWLMLGNCSNVRIYGNVFMGSSSDVAIGIAGVISTWVTNIYVNNGISIINNTFVDLYQPNTFSTPKIYFAHENGDDANVVCKNNLYYNTVFEWAGIDTHSHEAVGGGQGGAGTSLQSGISSTIFSSYAGDNFRLSAATLAGDSTVGSEYNTDPDGNIRGGADGVWDRGAYEYGGVADSTAPVITSVASSSVHSTGATISWTTDDSATSYVLYGLTAGYGSSASVAGYTTSHSIPLTGLTPSTTYHYRPRSTNSVPLGTVYGSDSTFDTAADDVTAPAVTVLAPLEGATISGNYRVTATNYDAIGVVGSQFFVDNALVNILVQSNGAATSARWTNVLATATLTNGPHTLKVISYDAKPNTNTSTTINFVSTNASFAANLLWKLDEDSGNVVTNTTANDTNVFTLIGGPTWIAGKLGRGLGFDGVNDRLTAPNSVQLDIGSNALTLCAWVNLTNTATGWQQIINKNSNPGGTESTAWHLFVGPGSSTANYYPGFQIQTDTETFFLAKSTTSQPYGTWVHLAGVYDGTDLRLYTNGVLDITATFAGTGNLYQTNLDLSVGSAGTLSEFMSGGLDEIRIFSSAQSASQILAIYNSGIVVDTVAPVITDFDLPATSTSLTNALTFAATDAVGLIYYLAKETTNVPAASDSRWSLSSPATFVFTSVPSNSWTAKLYGWAKDTAGNYATSVSNSTVITIAPTDTTKPVITAFVIPATAMILTVPITTWTATDDVAVTAYQLNQSAVAPVPTDANWVATKPTSYVFPDQGAQTLYAWAKDAAGNVSLSDNEVVTITFQPNVTPVLNLQTIKIGP
jgi:hypothetical protein